MTISRSKQWPRDAFTRAIWADDTLTPLQRLVALCYADYAADRPYSWVTPEQLRKRTGAGQTAIKNARAELIRHGWLQVKEPARQHLTAHYWLSVPTIAQPVGIRPAEVEPRRSESDARRSESDARRSESGPYYSVKNSGQARSAAEALPIPPQYAPAVAALIAQHGENLDVDTAAMAVAHIAQTRRIDNLTVYVSRFELLELQQHAAQHQDAEARSATIAARRCPTPGHTGPAGSDPDGDPLCSQCASRQMAPSLTVATRAEVTHLPGPLERTERVDALRATLPARRAEA